jgi:histone deacetylase 1/2
MTSDSESELEIIVTALRNQYGEVTSHKGLIHDWIGMNWDFSIPDQVTIAMEGYVRELLRKYGVTKRYKTPAMDDLFLSDPDSPLLSREKQEMYHSAVMTLHYLAKRTRPDILTSVSWCATRVLLPTEEDEKKLDRILGFLLYTQDQKLVLKIGPTCEVRAFVDSSFGLYPDGKSVTGAVIMLGNAPIYYKSAKQKIVTRSSTESELVGISDTLSQILWVREFLMAQGVPLGPAVLYQDNLSTIFLANKGRSTSERTRHIKIRYFFITHYVEMGEIRIEHMPTAQMIADILTKALHGTLFKKFSAAITGRSVI